MNRTQYQTASAQNTAIPYVNAYEHLADLRKKLELRIQQRVIMHRRHRENGDAWAAFVAISDREVDTLLWHGYSDAEAHEYTEEITSIDQNIKDWSAAIQRRAARSSEMGILLPVIELARIFGLSEMEVDALFVCIAPDIDRRYERLYGYLHDDMSRRRASIGLTLELCGQSTAEHMRTRSMFSPLSPLIKYQLLNIVNETPAVNPFMSQMLAVDRRIVSFLVGEPGFDHRIQDHLRWFAPEPRSSCSAAVHGTLAEQLVSAASEWLGKERVEKKPVFYLHGRPRSGKESLVRDICHRLRLPLLTVDAEQIAAGEAGFEKGIFLAFRENLLCQTVLLVKNMDRVLEPMHDQSRLPSLMKQVRSMGGITFLSGEKPWSHQLVHDGIFFLPVELRFPEYAEQAELWRNALQGTSDITEKEILRLVSKYPSSPGQIEDAVAIARAHAAMRHGDKSITQSDIDRGCRAQSLPDLGRLARKIETKHLWNDLVLPSLQQTQLREICNHVHYRSVVYGEWGFGRKLSLGKGLNALFFGPPGTGKTMAAEVIAGELRLDLYKIDLSQVVSKYIGETEKNLHQIFQEAQTSHAILFFDEADALLGKRSDAKDAHDRYANLEIAYLLQKMEEYEGITILATNLRQNMDEAFARRIRFIIEFPFPEEEFRKRIWERVWPSETPLAENIDLPYLAKRFKLSGGNIRNIAVTAAFSASSNDQRIDMKHLLNATKQEFLKMGRLIDESEYAER